ncbi:MAG: UDP-N-acetylglucosamine 4,6-dehydratase (inverting) [Bdellovibrionota bacterium]|nr:UDP-N-acetylglucosamine 4,6-dehydratase (inverting) [Bdellovibrionota bacterium]
MLDGKSILITGGTGSFGKAFVKRLLIEHPKVKKIIIYSRDEFKQSEMAQVDLFKEYASKLRFFIGDVRDAKRLRRACEGVDIIVHAAALKQVPAAEYNPMEFVKTNVLGAENVIEAAFDSGVSNVVALSTDKAAAPINLYGATKLCSDKLFVAANNMKGSRNLSLSVVRYGNVIGSRGSVVPLFLNFLKQGLKELPFTDKRRTRFNISLDEGVDMVFHAIANSWGGEVFIPKIPSFKITDLAEAVAPKCSIKEIGIRPGEKLHEEMITETDSLNTLDCGKYYVILPSMPIWNLDDYKKRFSASFVEHGFKYSSDRNAQWLDVQELRDLVKEYVDPSFQVVD